MSKLKLTQLEMFAAVVNARGFGAAAAELGCTQSRISHAIGLLETVVGTRLLKRTRRGCSPTEAGSRVLIMANEVLRLANSIEKVGEENTTLTGRVRVGAFRSVSSHLLPLAIKALSFEHPGIRVDIDDAYEEREDLSLAVSRGFLDIGIVQLPVASNLLTYRYVSDLYVLVVPQSIELTGSTIWEQLEQLPYLQLNCSGAVEAAERCRSNGFRTVASRTLTSAESIVSMIQHRVGYSILPRLTVFPIPREVRVLDLPVEIKRQFAVAVLPVNARSRLVQTVLSVICRKSTLISNEAFKKGLVSW